MQLTIPGGQKKGTPLNEADAKDIGYWLKRIEGDLEQNPNKRFADKDRAWVKGAREELDRRRGGGSRAPARPAPAAAAPPPTALAKAATTSLGKSSQDPAFLTGHLQDLAANYHIVTPATRVDALPEGCGVAISYVTVDPRTDKDGPGDVYPVGGGKVGLSGTTLAKIGAAAGVDWDSRESGRLDDGSDPHYCHFRAVARVRNFDGSVRTLTGEVEIDARDGSPQIDEIRQKAEASGRSPDAQILELRKFLLRHAESKAKNRAIASMGVKRSYNPAELQKPFAVARLMWTGETNDPELRRVFAEKTADAMIGGMSALYGRPPTALPQREPPVAAALPSYSGHAPPPVGAVDDSDYDTSAADYDTSGEEKPPSTPKAAAPAAQPAPVQPPPGAGDNWTPEEERY